MKPRPLLPTLVLPGAFARAQMQCRGTAYFQDAVLSTRMGMRRPWSEAGKWKGFAQATRCASTSATATSRARQPPPPPPPSSKSKHAKPGPPAKTSKTAHSPKLHAASHTSNAPAKRTAPLSTPPATTNTLVTANTKVNPPTFTYAPELSVPARKEGQNYASYLFSCGKAYLTFYKSGISHTRQTLKYAKQLRARMADQGKGVAKEIPGAGVLSRSEWQVLRRSKRDLLRLPVMGFLILALGEWLPLVVIYLTPVIPEACRIPTQVERVLRAKETKRRERLSRIAVHALRLQSQDRAPSADENAARLAAAAEALLAPEAKGTVNSAPMATAILPPRASSDLSLFHLLLLSARLDCHARLLDRLYLTPPKWLLQRNVSKTLVYLAQDDELIRRDGGTQALDEQELVRACVDRGIDVLGKTEAEQRKSLDKWYRI